MDEKELPFDRAWLEAQNEKAIQNQFFTPDHVYIELGLFKDIPIGLMYYDILVNRNDPELFKTLQTKLLPKLKEYQTRIYESTEPFLGEFGYSDTILDRLLKEQTCHDHVFMSAPATKFFELLIRHTIRNQNHSGPADRYVRQIEKDTTIVKPIEVTYHINTFPLKLSKALLKAVAIRLGESFGVNIRFLHKDPHSFDDQDWDSWLKSIDCFYLDSLGRFTGGAMLLQKQAQMETLGRYVFARKRFENWVKPEMEKEDFLHHIQIATSRLDIFFDFAWLQNNDVRLTEEKEDILNEPLDESHGASS